MTQEASVTKINAQNFRDTVKHNGLVQAFTLNYAAAFLAELNKAGRNGHLSDMQEEITLGIDVTKLK